MVLKWAEDDPLGKHLKDEAHPEWSIVGFHTSNWIIPLLGVKSTFFGKDGKEHHEEELHTYAKACIDFKRLSTAWGITLGMSVILIFVAYLSFWIDPGAVPARVTLNLVSLLIAANAYFSIESKLPKVTYNVFLLDFLFGLYVSREI